jgi:membrane-associated phospholipid phosphatase
MSIDCGRRAWVSLCLVAALLILAGAPLSAETAETPASPQSGAELAPTGSVSPAPPADAGELLTTTAAAADTEESLAASATAAASAVSADPSSVLADRSEPIVVRDHRTMRSYPANLYHNMAEVWTRPSLVPFLLGGAAAALTAPADNATVRFFERNPSRGFGRFGQTLGSGLIAASTSTALFGIGRFANGDRFRAATYDMSQAVLVNALYTIAIKDLARRQRPDGSNRQSFPSGHASNAFAAATVWAEQYGWKAAVPGYLAASFIATSRLAAAKHHLSDIVAGATVGIVVGHSVSRWDSKASHKAERRRTMLVPSAAPDGSGVGLALSMQF